VCIDVINDDDDDDVGQWTTWIYSQQRWLRSVLKVDLLGRHLLVYLAGNSHHYVVVIATGTRTRDLSASVQVQLHQLTANYFAFEMMIVIMVVFRHQVL